VFIWGGEEAACCSATALRQCSRPFHLPSSRSFHASTPSGANDIAPLMTSHDGDHTTFRRNGTDAASLGECP
jgi:hypothetical protein